MRKKWLFLTLLVIILFGVGGIVLWKFPKKDNSINQPTPQPHPGPPGKLSQAELEKYLLEKRLDLQKYFVFNLGNELRKREKEEDYRKINECKITSELSRDLTKLTALYAKKMEEKGYKLRSNKLSSKQWVTFVNQDFSAISNEDWKRKNINKQIENGKDKYVIFEKSDEFERVFFYDDGVDSEGQQWFSHGTGIFLRIEGSSTVICESKEKALEIIKTDPALIGKV